MHTNKIGKKGKLAALLAALAVVLGGAFSPLTPTASADTTTANTLAELKTQINNASGARTITLGNDIAWDGNSITIPAGKNITINGDHTIFRDKNATKLNSMFDVKGTLTLGGKVKLSGKTGSCAGPQTTTPKVSGPVTPKITTFWQQWPSDQKFGDLEGAKVIIGFRDIDRPVGGDDRPGVAYQYGDGRMFMVSEENVFQGITGPQPFPGRESETGEPSRVKRATKLKDGIDEDMYVFTIEDVDDDEWQAAYFRTNDGKYLGNPNLGMLQPVMIVEKGAKGYYKVEQQSNSDIINLKFQIGGPNWSVEKFFFPNRDEANPVVVGALTTAQSYTSGHEGGKLWVEERNVEGFFESDGTTPKLFHTKAAAEQWANEHAWWTVEGYDQHFDTQTQAQDWANDHATTTPGSCTIDNTCSKITTAMFNGSKGNEKGFFVQVSGNGVFNLQGSAELSNFLTGPGVSYVAPVVAKGGTVNIKGGKIHDNSAGYNADDSKNQQGAKQIQTYIEKNLAHTETAGAVMYLGGAKGAITGGTIENNRGDTGGILVEGEGTSVTMDGGAINKNVGIHYGGGAYVHFGGSLVMAGNATMNNNYAWDRGGAVYVSSQDYASSIVWPVIDPKEYKPAIFVMDGNAAMSGNYAVNRAGAVFVESHDVMLKSGQITGNFSRSLGGAIYVVGDGDKRMYQLYVPNACVTGNTAVKGGNAAPLNKALPNSTGDTCTVNNNLQSTGLLQGDNVDFKNHEGFGGGVWLCAFGGNATFGSGKDAQGNNANVVVAGNSAQPKQGADMHLRPTKPGAGSGINVLNNYSDDHWVNEVNNKQILVNQVYTGPLNVKNTGSAQCSGSMKISGNYARVGGGIASDGTVVFGPAKDIYRVHGKLDVTKTWENVPEKDRKAIDLQLAVKEGNTTYPLEGYKIRLDGKADVFDNENELQENDGKYNNESPAWESTPWNGTFGLPLVYTDNAGNIKPIFTFKDPDNASRTLNPAEPEDLPRLYELVTAKRLGTGNLTASLTIIETINGQAPTEYVYDGNQPVTLDADSSATDSKTLAQKTYKDRSGKVIGTVKTNKLALNMHKDISNTIPDEEPTVEKYVNQKVHDEIEFFDKEFTYDIMAYVPKDATSVTITDTLVEGLEFADANGKPTKAALSTIQKIAYRSTNDHTPGGSVAAAPEGTLVVSNQTVGIANGNKLVVTIDKATPLNKIKGKWVQVTFKARIKDDFRTIDALKTKGWSNTTDNKQGSPVPTAANDGLVKALNNSLTNDHVIKGVIGPARLFAKTANGTYWTTTNKQGTGGWTQVKPGDAQYNNTYNRLEGIDNSGTVMKLTVPPATSNYPVLTDESHEGMLNKATYTVTPTHDGVSSYETNTVTVKPKTTELKVKKTWNVNGSTNWPDNVKKVTFGIFDSNGKQVDTIDLTKNEPTKTVTGLAKLQGVTYSAKEISVTDANDKVTQVSNVGDNGMVKISDVLSFIAKVIKDAETYEVLNEAPQVEKYVNNNVHADIVNFDQVFEYSVMAYVPQGATKVEITDTLSNDLLFVDYNGKVQGQDGFDASKLITNSTGMKKFDLVIEPSNNHQVNGTVARHSNTSYFSQHAELHVNGPLKRADGVVLSNGGKTITVTVNENELNANGKQVDAHGKWIVLSFRATINPASYENVAKQVKAGADPVAGSTLSWQKISDDKTVTGGSKPHAGLDNTAKYQVFVGNEGSSNYETNTVTVKPETTELKVKKNWNVNGSTNWPDNVKKVTFGIFDDKGTQVDTIDLEKGEAQPKVSQPLPKLKKDPTCEPTAEKPCESIAYTAKEISITTADNKVTDVVSTGDNGVANVNTDPTVGDVLSFIAHTIKDAEAYVALNEAPQVEKYVNNNVHAELEGFDEVFEYSVMAYVPQGATKVEITDTLSNDLLFVDLNGKVQGQDGFDPTKLITNSTGMKKFDLVIEPNNNHKVNGTVKGHSDVGWFSNHPERHVNGPLKRADGVQLGDVNGENFVPSPGGKTITVTVNENELNANGKQVDAHGKWIVLSFRATINPASYAKVQEQLGKGEDPAVAGLSWQKITDDKTVTGGSKPHAGLDNTAKYKVFVGNEGSSNYETNTVTVKPGTTKVYATKSWLDEKGDPMDWPSDVQEVKVNVYGEGSDPVDTLTITKDPGTGKATVAKSKELPKLDGVTYTVEEKEIPGYTPYGTVTGSGTEDDPYVFNNQKNGGPQIEKYINNGVHENLDKGFDTSFKYDIIAYVPNDADEIVIKDKLVNALEFAKAPAGGALSNDQTAAAEASTNPDEVVTSIVVKDDNNHQVGTKPAQYPNATVLAAGDDVRGKATVAINGKNLEVRFGSESSPITAADGLRGKYIQITFWAKYTQQMIDAAQVGDSKTITGNGAIIGGMNRHDGTTNDASYDIRVGGGWEYDVKSNTVTVKGKDTQLEATKQWQNADGSTAGWPDGVEKVEIKVYKNDDKSDVVDTIELTADSAIGKSKKLPVLVGVEYKLDEVTVPGYQTTRDGNTFINKDNGTPQIEKYINKDVDAHLSEYDKHFTYDIMAFVPFDAEAITITDPLVESLEFANASGEASTDKTAVVKSVVVKDANDHKAKGTVSSTDGTPLSVADVATIDGKNLKVEIADATGYRGKWIQVTFYAKYTQAAIDNAIATPVPDNKDVDDNGSVISSIKTHDGTKNDASYTLKINNEWSKAYESNTVTHDAETVTVEAEKQWQKSDGSAADWPENVPEVAINVLNGTKVVDTIKLTAAKPKASSKELPKLTGVTYTLDEVAVPGYQTTRDGNIFINKDNGTPQIEKYINKDVDAHLVEYDKVIEYDIMAFVPFDAEAIIITDPLVDSLEFSDATGHASTDKTAVVKSVVAKEDNDHKAKGTVSADNGTPVDNAAISFADMGKRLNVEITDATAYRGKWIQVTFYAKYTDDAIRNATTTPVPDNEDVKSNGSVISSIKTHDGTANTASYTLKINNEWSSEYKSNTVTHDAKTVTVEAEKQWQNADGTTAEWPSDVAEVKVDVLNGDKVVDTITLTSAKPKASSKELPKLTGVTYQLKEKPVFGYLSTLEGNVVVNKDAGKPQIEKYINKDVDAHLVEFDKSFTYDILAFVPRDADEIVINDTLVKSLEFAKAADGTASVVPGEVVTSIVAKADNDHTALTGTVAKTDGAVELGGNAVPAISADGRTLTVTVADATAYRGQWIQVTFTAKYTEETIKAAEVRDSKTISDNGSVISEITKHDGTANTASYDIRVRNEWKKDVKSNTVTHDAGTVTVEAEKQWKHADGRAITTWPVESVEVKVINDQTNEVVDTITLTQAQPKASSKALPKLTGVTYKIVEADVPAGYTSTVEGQVVVNKAKTYPVEFSKREFGVDTEELEGAKIKVTDSEGNVVDEWTSSADGPHTLNLEAGEYTFEEVNAPAGFEKITTTITFTVDTEGKVTLKEAYENINGKVSVKDTNHLILEDMPEAPAIEKYVNKDVHQNLVEFDRTFVYDVMVYVSGNAASAEIYDTLVGDLEFAVAGEGRTDAYVDGVDTKTVVTSVVVKDTNDHTAEGTVSSTDGTPVDYTAEIDGKNLTVKVADVAAARGKWLQVTFSARIMDENRLMGDLATELITDNGTVISEKFPMHNGVPNTASYLLFNAKGDALQSFVDENTGEVKPDESNTVTVIPETTSVTIKKQWLNAAGWQQASPAQWPAGATVTVEVKNGDEVVRTVILDEANQTATIDDLPKLIDVTYTVEEVALDGVFALEGEEKVFEVEDGKTVTLVNRLAPKKSEMAIEVAKVDEAGEKVKDAKLRVTDSEGNKVDEWTTDGSTNHLLPHIVPGTYTLEETGVPQGYMPAAPVTFEVTEKGIVKVNGKEVDTPVIEMVDKKKPPVQTTSPGKTPDDKNSTSPGGKTPGVTTRPLVRTGSPAGIAMLMAFGLLGAGAGVLVARRYRR